MAGSNDIKQHFNEAHSVLEVFLSDDTNFDKIKIAGDYMLKSLNLEGRIFSCGNGGSMCDAMHFAEEMTGRFRNDRDAYPAVAIADPSHITCVANDYGFDYIFSRYIQAHGKKGDTLLAISTSGNSKNVLQAVKEAKSLGMHVIALTGKDGGQLAAMADVEIRAPKSEYADRVQEIHIKIIHSLIDYIEKNR